MRKDSKTANPLGKEGAKTAPAMRARPEEGTARPEAPAGDNTGGLGAGASGLGAVVATSGGAEARAGLLGAVEGRERQRSRR